MAETLTIEELVNPDDLAHRIADRYMRWEAVRKDRVSEWQELQRYIFATSTAHTTNSTLDWSNKTTIPKMCQIRDNLVANYLAALFPRRKWATWEGDSELDESIKKKKAIESYMSWVTDRNEFYNEVTKLVYDYVDYGNVFVTPEWKDQSKPDGKTGFVGPLPKRISPSDIVFDPTVSTFTSAPKIVRSIVNLGDLKKIIMNKQFNTPEEYETAQALYDHILEYRGSAQTYQGSFEIKDDIYQVAGYTSYREYLCSDDVEVLTFYGDLFDGVSLQENRIITVVDRCKVTSNIENPSIFGYTPIFHVGWRIRPDTLWAMGPLDNLVGMQYRIDHLENMKADVFDTIAYPPLKVKGYVQDFEWKPMERIYVGDDGDVTMLSPDVQALQADTQIAILEQKMEEMAGSPKEAMGFRTPGEKTMYEVQRLELAAGRIFQSKVAQFERDLLEPLLNAMLELARRNMGLSTIRIFNDENKLVTFQTLTPEDIIAAGRIRPIAARNFAEKSLIVQNLNNFFSSSAGADPLLKVHFSSVKLAQMWEMLLDIEQYKLVEPYVQIVEQADAQRMQQAVQQQVAIESQTPAGLYPGDTDEGVMDEGFPSMVPGDGQVPEGPIQ